MTCFEAETYVSAIHDGESVPADAAQHVAECGTCRQILNDYSLLGAEMRLAAAVQTSTLPELSLPANRKFWHFLRTGVRVPRFAVAGMLAGLVVATLAAVMVRAQSRPLWFQFAYGLKNNPRTAYRVAQTGYEDGGATMTFLNGSLVGVETRVRVKSVSFDDVVLQIRAVSAKLEVRSQGTAMVARNAAVSLAGAPLIHYKPGEDLSVPIEGGGVLYLRGMVSDHQPKIAFGSPLEPEVGEMIVRSPTLTAQGRLIAELTGASATAGNEQPQSGILLNTKEGKFVFALTQFPGAVEGKAEWGRINFKLGDVAYQLVAAAPITGGDQPAKVWVRRDEADGDPQFLGMGSGPI